MVSLTAGRRWLAAAAATYAVAVVAGLQMVTAQPAAALPPLTLNTGTSGPVSTEPVKSAEAFCGLDQVVVGGGGEVVNEPAHTTVLTALEPHAVEGPTPPRFVVRALALACPQLQEFWSVTAYALCAPAASMQPSYLIMKSTVSTLTSRFKAGTAKCTGGRVAYSAGVTTLNTSRFGVQLVRTSGPLDIARATVRTFLRYGDGTGFVAVVDVRGVRAAPGWDRGCLPGRDRPDSECVVPGRDADSWRGRRAGPDRRWHELDPYAAPGEHASGVDDGADVVDEPGVGGCSHDVRHSDVAAVRRPPARLAHLPVAAGRLAHGTRPAGRRRLARRARKCSGLTSLL